MINEKRVYHMTQMARYEQNKARHDEHIGSYFRSDYISGRLLESFFCATIAYAIILGLYCIYHFEEIMVTVYSEEVMRFVSSAVVFYLVFTAVYLLFSLLIYYRRYKHAVQDLKLYYIALRKLSDEYEEEEQE